MSKSILEYRFLKGDLFMSNFANQVVLITEGSSNIGTTCALSYARAGAIVILSGKNTQTGTDLVAGIKEDGGQAHFYKADLAQSEEVIALMNYINQNYGKLDLAINNTGLLGASSQELATDPTAEWAVTIDTSLKSMWLCMQYEKTLIQEGINKAIVNMTTLPETFTQAVAGMHLAYKKSVECFTRNFAALYHKEGIRVNTIDLSSTGMISLWQGASASTGTTSGPTATSQQVTDLAMWLTTGTSPFVTGTLLAVPMAA